MSTRDLAGELARALGAAHDQIQHMADTVHHAYHHEIPASWHECPRPFCADARELVDPQREAPPTRTERYHRQLERMAVVHHAYHAQKAAREQNVPPGRIIIPWTECGQAFCADVRAFVEAES